MKVLLFLAGLSFGYVLGFVNGWYAVPMMTPIECDTDQDCEEKNTPLAVIKSNVKELLK